MTMAKPTSFWQVINQKLVKSLSKACQEVHDKHSDYQFVKTLSLPCQEVHDKLTLYQWLQLVKKLSLPCHKLVKQLMTNYTFSVTANLSATCQFLVTNWSRNACRHFIGTACTDHIGKLENYKLRRICEIKQSKFIWQSTNKSCH
jgi:hypothetical protein